MKSVFITCLLFFSFSAVAADSDFVKLVKSQGQISEIKFEFFKNTQTQKPKKADLNLEKINCVFKEKQAEKILKSLEAKSSNEEPSSVLGESVTIIYKSGEQKVYHLLARSILQSPENGSGQFFVLIQPLSPKICQP